MFAHLWLGSGSALDRVPPLRDAFCRFFLEVGPPRVVLTHLEDFGRSAEDFWGVTKAEGARERLRQLDSQVQVEIARMGDCVQL